ncbi:transcription antitermination factor NusB [Daejeonella sp. H1SJ63]|jgi:N utilization substance protein B|uniref:transcription antitermination factor NusB n=1 Tax=Daejeonella sp. H1SJ63 TaxID=3034145 RepID=UPI0023EDDE26|nr:transcription antitermination factor NusB [Daejeonella sp. H1SJ63]
MLNRRHLRVKALQVLYSYQQSEVKDIVPFEKALIQSVDKVSEMYIFLLSLLIEVADYSIIDAGERANKHLPSEEDLNASLKLHDNLFISALRQNAEYQAAVKKYKISWDFDPEICKSIFITLKATPEYNSYLNLTEHSIQTDKDIIKYIFKKLILKSPGIEQVFEEKFINWPVDKEVLQALVAKTFKNFSHDEPNENKLAVICPNWDEDRPFIADLFKKVIAFETEYQDMIAQKTKNWDSERIALMDTLLMRMAITELIHFSSIPVKVTMNEYIEIAKEFSTPKSNSFINGILDKILADLKASGKVRKIGKGLIE